MSEIINSLKSILDKRQTEIAISKKNILLAKTEEQRKSLYKASVMLIYSATEGGVRELVGIVFDQINRSSINVVDLSPEYLELAIGNTCRLKSAITDYDKMIRASVDIRNAVIGKAKLAGSVDLESNITPKVIKRVCFSLCIDYFLNNKNESDLNLLLRYRNNISHGDSEMPITMERIAQFSDLSYRILYGIAERIDDVCKNKKWLTIAST